MNALKFLFQIFWNSRYMKVSVGIIAALSFFRDQILPSQLADKLRLVEILRRVLAWRVGVPLILTFILFAFCEGILSWRREKVAPLLGEVGSLQFEALENAARIRRCVDDFIKLNGSRPVCRDGSHEQAWIWDKHFSKAFDAEVKDGLRAFLRKLERENQQSLDIQDAISLATLNLDQVWAAYLALVSFSFASSDQKAPQLATI